MKKLLLLLLLLLAGCSTFNEDDYCTMKVRTDHLVRCVMWEFR